MLVNSFAEEAVRWKLETKDLLVMPRFWLRLCHSHRLSLRILQNDNGQSVEEMVHQRIMDVIACDTN